jgi:glycosyltransferase involved in cell wall biosynthesis
MTQNTTTLTDSPLISIVAPFHNEGENVLNYYEAIKSVIDQLSTYDFELVCVDDGSSDNTLEQLIALSHNDSRIVIIELSRNFGKEAALTAGLENAIGHAVIPIDSDLQDPPELISQMIDKWSAGAEVVLARRIDRRVDTLLKRTTAKLFYKFHNRISGIQIPNNVGDFRLMDKNVIDALMQLPERQRFMKGLFAWVGFRAEIIDYTRAPRPSGESKFSGMKLWELAVEGITSFSTAPLKVWTYIGGCGILLSLTYAIFIIIKTLTYGADAPGYASIIVAILFIGSIQLIGIGVLGEYIGRIYMETKQRPTYIIRQKHSSKNED